LKIERFMHQLSMSKFFKPPLNRRLALVLAVGAMWLLGGLGIYVLHRSDHWFFIGLDGYDATTLVQIGAYYFACVGAQLPALCLSDFARPVRTACFATLGLQGVLLVARLVLWRWASVAPALNPSIPLLAEVAYVGLLVAHEVFLAWLVTGPLARYFRR
jgi:hypothetical protein